MGFVVQLLASSRADLDKANNVDATPLFMASEFGHAEVAEVRDSQPSAWTMLVLGVLACHFRIEQASLRTAAPVCADPWRMHLYEKLSRLCRRRMCVRGGPR